MRFFRHISIRLASALIGIVFAYSSLGGALPVPHASAIDYEPYNTVVNAFSWVENAVTAAASSVTASATQSLAIKEFVLDDIAFSIAKMMLNEIRKSTIRWINSGFNGDPMFVTDLEGFLVDSADKIAGEIIYGSDLDFLCSPFELEVRIALDAAFPSSPSVRDEVQCRFSDAVSNVEDFLAGDLSQGGLAGWFEMTVIPQNNFYGAYASAEAAIRGRQADGRERELAQLSWGSGFLSKLTCSDENEDDCLITMPGRAVSEALTFELSTGSRALIEADEFNEVISALFAQLATEALTGAGGLLGLSTPRRGNASDPCDGLSYLDRMGNSLCSGESGGGGGSGGAGITEAIADENRYRGRYGEIVSSANTLTSRVQGLIEEDDRRADPPPPQTPEPRIYNRTCLVGIRQEGQQIRSSAQAEQASADENIALLRELERRYDEADARSNDAELTVDERRAAQEEKLNIMDEFMTLKASGTLHSAIEAARHVQRIQDIKDRLDRLRLDIEQSCRIRDERGP